jgi:hypothetical protein
MSNTILRLGLCRDKATARVLQVWYRIEIMAGKLRGVETNAVQDEHSLRFWIIGATKGPFEALQPHPSWA